MTMILKRPLVAVAALLLTGMAIAQKPAPVSALEIRLPEENDNWYMLGNMRMQQRTGTPAAIYQLAFRVAGSTPEEKAKQYLEANKTLLGISTADIQALKLHAIRTDAAGTVVRLRQTWKGLPVNKNAEITVHITPDSKVDYVMNGFRYGIAMDDVTPVVLPASARQSVLSHLAAAGNISHDASELMVLRHQQRDYLVYRINIATDQPVGEWEAYVDAKTGTLLQVTDIADYHHHDPAAKKPLPAGKPLKITATGTGNVFDPDPLTTALGAYGGSYVDGSDANAAVLTAQLKSVTLNDITLSAGTYSLVGPYAEIRDFEAPSKGLFTQASSTFAFDRNADAFEAVNTYYHIDAMMRYLNTTLSLGIMPYQYAGGVRFDPSGLSGADNSHYLSGSGQLAFGEGGVDDAEDADVIIHELGHGLHDWVTSGGLSQVNGLSEGTGDYIAGSYSRFRGYWTTANAAYHWMFNWDGHNPFWGGRVLNYGAVYPGGLTGAIHTDGQIWATANMKIWDDIGRQKADRAFWTGLGMTNSSTNQNDAANAVYQASITLGYTGAERTAIHARYTAAGYTLPPLVLPVKLSSFNAVKSGSQTLVSWQTASEENLQSFAVERSLNGVDYSTIGTVIPAGNSSTTRGYTFTDVAPANGKNYYRLRSVSANGSNDYSAVALVIFGKDNQLLLFPNPVKDILTIKNATAGGTVAVFDLNGKQVLSQKIPASNSQPVTIRMNGFPAGMYMVQLTANGKIAQGTIVKE
ncbi:MAG: T9SS type A sorting domain-containing protein [Chitinophagaceae bacterium]|nr:T9SS type A sorting domain-containing protein [Chitinophagaceae bacterium]